MRCHPGIGMYTMTDIMLMCSHLIPIVCGGTGDLIILGIGIVHGIMEVGIHHIGMVTIGEVVIGDITIIGTIIICLILPGVVIGVSHMDGMALQLIDRVSMPEDTIVTFEAAVVLRAM